MKGPMWILAMGAALALCACSGRASLSESSGRAFRTSWQIQANSRPQPPLADLSARDAKYAMENHAARYSASGGQSSGGGSTGPVASGTKGLLTPVTQDVGNGFDADPGASSGRRGIRLEAR